MIFGGIGVDRLLLNEDTLWSGTPESWDNPQARQVLPNLRRLIAEGDYAAADLEAKKAQGPYTQSYLPMGEFVITHRHGDTARRSYRRELDMATGIARVWYQIGDVSYSREIIASHPDQVIAVALSADRPGMLTFTAALGSQLRHRTAATPKSLELLGEAPSHADPVYYDRDIPIRYDGAGMRFSIKATAITRDGHSAIDHDGIHVDGASEALLLLTAATSFNGYDKPPATQGRNAALLTERALSSARAKSWIDLRAGHIRDHGALFDRVALQIDIPSSAASSADERTTDERIISASKGDDPYLIELLFQYGRYLLIASSRPGTQPANLQGIWNDHIRPPWSSNWTLNINAEMNYWPAETAGLPDLHQPLLDFISDLAVTGSRTAATNYGARGWTAHHNSDIWRHSAPVGDFGHGDPVWAFWPMAGAWLAQHPWEHYAFGGDLTYLRRHAYPVMKGAAEFCLDWMVQDKDGHFTTSPSTSPEHKFVLPNGRRAAVSMGAAMDLALIWDLLNNTVDAAELLDLDVPLREKMTDALKRLAPYRIDANGALQEWSHDLIGAEREHRHFSHLFGLFPGRQITPATPALFSAARRSLELRGNGGTGWSLGWKINAWARLLDGDHALQLLGRLLRFVDPATPDGGSGGVYPNLFDAHPPFQIDGNFAATSGVTEMLVQSHAGEIHLLPALPTAWPQGRVRGLRARGGFDVSMEWASGRLVRAAIKSRLGRVCRIRTHAAVSLGGAEVRRAEGPNPNPFYRTHAAAPPVDPAGIWSTSPVAVSGEVFEFATRPNGVYSLSA